MEQTCSSRRMRRVYPGTSQIPSEELWLFRVSLQTPKLYIIQIIFLRLFLIQTEGVLRGPNLEDPAQGKRRWAKDYRQGMVRRETPMVPLTHQRQEAQALLAWPCGNLLRRLYFLYRIPSASLLVSGTSPLPDDPAALHTHLHFSNDICLLAYLSFQLFEGKDSVFFISCIPRSWHRLCTQKIFVLRLTLEPEMFKSLEADSITT